VDEMLLESLLGVANGQAQILYRSEVARRRGLVGTLLHPAAFFIFLILSLLT